MIRFDPASCVTVAFAGADFVVRAPTCRQWARMVESAPCEALGVVCDDPDLENKLTPAQAEALLRKVLDKTSMEPDEATQLKLAVTLQYQPDACNCAYCSKGEVEDEPTPDEPVFVKHIPCPSCDGKGCKDCRNRGELMLTQCPHRSITHHTYEVLRMVRLTESGLPPVHGGWLDQCHSFALAFDLVTQLQRYWRAKLNLPHR